MEPSLADSGKPMPVITDISQRAIRERNPDDPRQDPKVLAEENSLTDENVPAQRRGRGKKGGYGNYASALRKTDAGQSDLLKRKEKYAAALEGARIDEDDLDDFYKDTGINPDEPDIMSTVPLGIIKGQYLSEAKEEGKIVPHSEERPIPHQLHPQSWPPRDDTDAARKPQVIDISEGDEKPKRDGVDAGHVESVNILKERWQNLPEKYRNKPLGVNKPYAGIKGDNKWITHFRPVIDEGVSPEDPEWLKMVRHRRWMSTVKARFPEDENRRINFERRSTTPRKFKKPNPYTVMRSTTDIDSEFDEVMRRRRKHSDAAEEGDYLTKSQTSFLKSASSFRSADFTDSGRSTGGGGGGLVKPVQGPIKEYLKNLSLERVRGSMLKWSFSADIVDDPYRFDLPKPIDLLVMDELERENEWKYEQARRQFLADGGEGMSIQSSSHASFVSEPEDIHEDGTGHKLLDESAGFIPKLTDIQQKLQDEVDSKPVMKSSSIEEDSKIIPNLEGTKDKYLHPDEDPLIYDTAKKKPFEYQEDERHFEGVKDVKKKLPVEPKPDKKPELIMPTTVMKGDKDFKKIMKDRKTAADDSVVDRAESAAQDIKTLASDISKSFGESEDKSTKSPKPEVSTEPAKEKQEQPKAKESIPEKKAPDQPKAQPKEPKKEPAKDKKQEKPKDITFEKSPEQTSTSK